MPAPGYRRASIVSRNPSYTPAAVTESPTQTITSPGRNDILEATEESIFREFNKEVPSSFVGDTVARLLRSVDQVAYVRFASVYHQFKDVGQFIDEAKQVLESSGHDAADQPSLFDQGAEGEQ